MYYLKKQKSNNIHLYKWFYLNKKKGLSIDKPFFIVCYLLLYCLAINLTIMRRFFIINMGMPLAHLLLHNDLDCGMNHMLTNGLRISAKYLF